MARVAVDALGGDNAPDEVVLGALDAAADGVQVTLFGPAGLETKGLPLVVTTETIEMSDKPAEAVRAKPDSSLVAAVRSVSEGTTDAVVSAGNTGAVLAAGMIHLRRLPGGGVRIGHSRREDPGVRSPNNPRLSWRCGYHSGHAVTRGLRPPQPSRQPRRCHRR